MVPKPGKMLASWRDTGARAVITAFVEAVTNPASPLYRSQRERVAVFDCDGTVWCEKPLPVHLDFALRQRGIVVRQDRAAVLAEREAAMETDRSFTEIESLTQSVHDQAEDEIAYVVEAVDRTVAIFLRNAVHPTLHRPYAQCAYRPMIELIRYLEHYGFKSYIATESGGEFVRVISEEAFGIPLERVISSDAALAFRDDAGGARVVHTGLRPLVDRWRRPIHIWNRIGRRPILVVGNADSDIPMFRFAGGDARQALRLLVHHDDAEREFAYAGGAETALAMARDDGWTIVSMNQDWLSVF
jgi:hypothetical protein